VTVPPISGASVVKETRGPRLRIRPRRQRKWGQNWTAATDNDARVVYIHRAPFFPSRPFRRDGQIWRPETSYYCPSSTRSIRLGYRKSRCPWTRGPRRLFASGVSAPAIADRATPFSGTFHDCRPCLYPIVRQVVWESSTPTRTKKTFRRRGQQPRNG